jgi:hypothetical protein
MLTLDKETHIYTDAKGKAVPSVTQILAPLNAVLLRSVPRDTLERRRDLGRRVHLACEYDDLNDIDEESVTDDVRPYLEGWRAFKRAKGVQTIHTEELVHNTKLGYAGTLDWHGRIDGIEWVLDRKTSTLVLPSYWPQVFAYYLAKVSDDPEPRRIRRGLLQLTGDNANPYKLVPTDTSMYDEAKAFLACLTIHQFMKAFQ